MLSAPSLQMHSIPPRITEKSYRLRVSNRTMVGVLEPPRFACVASEPKASNHQVMEPSKRNRRLPCSVRNTSRTPSLSRSQIGLDASRQIHLLSERTEGKSFLDIHSHRTHPTWLWSGFRSSECGVGDADGSRLKNALQYNSESFQKELRLAFEW